MNPPSSHPFQCNSCDAVFTKGYLLKRHVEMRASECKKKPKKALCYFCGFGPGGLPRHDMHRMAEHCLSELCQAVTKAQWKIKNNEAVKNRINLWLPTVANVVKLINEHHAPLKNLLVEHPKDKTEKAKA